MRRKRIDLYPVLFVIFIFQPIIEKSIGVFKYFDEIIVLLFFMKACFIIIKSNRLSVFQSKIIKLLFFLIVIGCLGNHFSKANQPLSAIIQDIYSNCKLFLFVFSLQNINLPYERKEALKDKLATIIHGVFIILFSCSIVSLFVNIGMTDFTEGTRYGLRAFQFLYYNPAGLNTYFYLLMIINSITLIKNGKIRKNAHLYTFIGIIPWLLTLRSRAIAFAVLYCAVYYYMFFIKKEKIEKQFKWYHVILAASGVFLLCWDAIEKYFISNEKASRFQLMHKSIDIAKDYFPLGSGFGTFGTEASRNYYSSIYYKYDMWNVWGLSENAPVYIVDQFWFGIIGQFGIVGTMIIVVLIYTIYKNIWNIACGDKAGQMAAITLFATSIFASLTAGTFIQASILPSVLVFFLVYGKNSNEYTYYIAR